MTGQGRDSGFEISAIGSDLLYFRLESLIIKLFDASENFTILKPPPRNLVPLPTQTLKFLKQILKFHIFARLINHFFRLKLIEIFFNFLLSITSRHVRFSKFTIYW